MVRCAGAAARGTKRSAVYRVSSCLYIRLTMYRTRRVLVWATPTCLQAPTAALLRASAHGVLLLSLSPPPRASVVSVPQRSRLRLRVGLYPPRPCALCDEPPPQRCDEQRGSGALGAPHARPRWRRRGRGGDPAGSALAGAIAARTPSAAAAQTPAAGQRAAQRIAAYVAAHFPQPCLVGSSRAHCSDLGERLAVGGAKRSTSAAVHAPERPRQ